MERIKTPTRVPNKFGLGKDGFGDGNPGLGVPSTQLEADWFDNAQEEIANAIELSGIPLDSTDMTQLYQAILRVARRRLHADETYHISPAPLGDDTTGDGSQTAPWATLQHAWVTLAASIDTAGFEVTIQLAPGNHDGAQLRGQIPGTATAPIRIVGNPADPASVRVLQWSQGVINLHLLYGAQVLLDGVQFDGGTYQLYAGENTFCQYRNVFFTACTSHVTAAGNGIVQQIGNSRLIASATGANFVAQAGGSISFVSGTLFIDVPQATPQFVYLENAYLICRPANEFEFLGQCLGRQYTVTMNGVLLERGGNPGRIPGDLLGEIRTGGQDGRDMPLLTGDGDWLVPGEYGSGSNIAARVLVEPRQPMRDFHSGLAEIVQLRPRAFGSGDASNVGLIPTEIEEIIPEAVLEQQPRDEEDDRSREERLHRLDHPILCAAITAIKELNDRLRTIEMERE